MASVTCPTCDTRQPLADRSGYTCAECGTAWAIVTCDACNGRFHMRPGTEAWTCPTCGTVHEPSGAYEPPEPAAAAVPLRGLPGAARLWIAVGVAVVAIVAGAIVFTGGGGEPTTSPSSSPPPSLTAEEAQAALCQHQNEFPTLRYEAIGRYERTLEDDAAALRAAGDEETAAAVDELVAGVDAIHTALGNNEPTDDLVATVIDDLAALPC